MIFLGARDVPLSPRFRAYLDNAERWKNRYYKRTRQGDPLTRTRAAALLSSMLRRKRKPVLYFHGYQLAQILGVSEKSIHRATHSLRNYDEEWIKRHDLIVFTGFRHEEGQRGCRTYLVARYSAIMGGYKVFDRTAGGRFRWLQTTWSRIRAYWNWIAAYLFEIASLYQATDILKIDTEDYFNNSSLERPPPLEKQAFSKWKPTRLAQYFAFSVLDHLAEQGLFVPEYGSLVGFLTNVFKDSYARPQILDAVLQENKKMEKIYPKLKNPTGYLFKRVKENLENHSFHESERRRLTYTWYYGTKPNRPDIQPIIQISEETELYI